MDSFDGSRARTSLKNLEIHRITTAGLRQAGALAARISSFSICGGVGEQLIGLGHQRLGDRAVEVGVASGFIGEGVEDAEPVRPQLDGVPGRGGQARQRPGAEPT